MYDASQVACANVIDDRENRWRAPVHTSSGLSTRKVSAHPHHCIIDAAIYACKHKQYTHIYKCTYTFWSTFAMCGRRSERPRFNSDNLNWGVFRM